MKRFYISGSGKRYSPHEILDILRLRIEKEKHNDHEVKLLIGADSQVIEDKGEVRFAVAIALHIVGHGGIFFIRKFREYRSMHLSERLYTEATGSIEEANMLKDAGILDMVDSVEVHCDVGSNGSSRDYVTALKGMIAGFGFNGYAKPEAMAASSIADRHTK